MTKRRSRRELLRLGLASGAAALTGCSSTKRETGVARALPATAEIPTVDVHSHVFNANDLPVAGFLEQTLGWHGARDALTRVEAWLREATMDDNEEQDLVDRLSSEMPDLREIPVREPTALEIADALSGAWRPGIKSLTRPDARDAAEIRRAFDKSLPSLEGMSSEGILKKKTCPLPAADAWIAQSPELKETSNLSEWLRRLRGAAPFIRVVGSPRLAIAQKLLRDNAGAGVSIAMLVDFDHWQPDSCAHVPPSRQIRCMQLLSKLSIRGRLVPDFGWSANGDRRRLLHPFVAFDPRREVEEAGATLHAPPPPALPIRKLDRLTWRSTVIGAPEKAGSLETVRAAITAGFVGVKLYPPVGFKPLGNEDARLDAALQRLYGFCEREHVPITAHANASNGFGPGLDEDARPSNWRPVLEAFPQLRLNFGHFGHMTCAESGYGWADEAIALMKETNHVYADVANCDIPVPAEYVRFLRGKLDETPLLRSRLLYGSDWFMDELVARPGDSPADYLPTMRDRLGKALFPNDLAAFMGGNALRFLGFLDAPANKNRGRLRTFYGDEPLPAWLRG